MFTVSHGATSWFQHNVCEQRWVLIGNLNNLPSEFSFIDDPNFGDFTLLFCRRRQRNVQSFKTHVLNYCSDFVLLFCYVLDRCHRTRILLKVPIYWYKHYVIFDIAEKQGLLVVYACSSVFETHRQKADLDMPSFGLLNANNTFHT